MKSNIQSVMPWGRSLAEYRAMFALDDGDLDRSIVSAADGPASFNAEMAEAGRAVTSVDPVYTHTVEALRGRIADVRDTILENTALHREAYRWDAIPDLAALERIRTDAMDRFLRHYRNGGAPRYCCAALPRLPFPDGAFDLALCSHFLFTYSRQLDADLHIAAALELARVAKEVRIFPLLDMNGAPSPHVDPVGNALRKAGRSVTTKRVPYEFQKGGHTMMVITDQR